jgi:hypothetical protein
MDEESMEMLQVEIKLRSPASLKYVKLFDKF